MSTHYLTDEAIAEAFAELDQFEASTEAPRLVLDASRPTLHDAVRRPSHYVDGPVPGVECVEIAQFFPYCLGAAIKYIWRAGRKGDAVEDLRKAQQYIQFQIDGLAGGVLK